VPPFVSPAGAQGGTSACSTGAALSFVSCIALFGNVVDFRNLDGGVAICDTTRPRLRWPGTKKRRPVMRRHDELDNLPSFRDVK